MINKFNILPVRLLKLYWGILLLLVVWLVSAHNPGDRLGGNTKPVPGKKVRYSYFTGSGARLNEAERIG
jgi:hypothetical protein